MKKIFLAIILGVITFAGFSQTIVRVKQGTAADTLKASTTYTMTPISVLSATTQLVSATVAIDSVSGNPAGTFTLEQSVDGIHWNTTGSTWTFTNSGTGTHSSVLSLNPFLGAYVRVKTVTTATTQKSKYWITIYSRSLN